MLLNTIFEYSYLSFGWEIGHPLRMYLTRAVLTSHPKGGKGYHASCVRTHLQYLFSCFSHMVSCFICRNLRLRHIVQYICAIGFKRIFWNNPTAETITLNAYTCLQGREGLKNRSYDTYVLNGWPQVNVVEYFSCTGTSSTLKHHHHQGKCRCFLPSKLWLFYLMR